MVSTASWCSMRSVRKRDINSAHTALSVAIDTRPMSAEAAAEVEGLGRHGRSIHERESLQVDRQRAIETVQRGFGERIVGTAPAGSIRSRWCECGATVSPRRRATDRCGSRWRWSPSEWARRIGCGVGWRAARSPPHRAGCKVETEAEAYFAGGQVFECQRDYAPAPSPRAAVPASSVVPVFACDGDAVAADRRRRDRCRSHSDRASHSRLVR